MPRIDRIIDAHPDLTTAPRVICLVLGWLGPTDSLRICRITGVSRASFFRAARLLEDRGIISRVAPRGRSRSVFALRAEARVA